MAFVLHRSGFPGIAASASLNKGAAVGIASAVDRSFVALATNNIRPFGIALATAANPTAVGGAVAILDEGNTERVTAIASLGRGAEIGVASTNGGLGPVAAASGVAVFSVGQSVSAAANGEAFSLYVNPRQLSGLV